MQDHLTGAKDHFKGKMPFQVKTFVSVGTATVVQTCTVYTVPKLKFNSTTQLILLDVPATLAFVIRISIGISKSSINHFHRYSGIRHKILVQVQDI